MYLFVGKLIATDAGIVQLSKVLSSLFFSSEENDMAKKNRTGNAALDYLLISDRF